MSNLRRVPRWKTIEKLDMIDVTGLKPRLKKSRKRILKGEKGLRNSFLLWGGIFAFLAVALGAFGAHGLKDKLTEDMLVVYETGVRYQMYHAIGLIFISIIREKWPNSSKMKWAGRLFFFGIIFFSGSLYVLSVTGIKVLGAITPIGGVLFLCGWALLVVQAFAGRGEKA